LPEQTLFAGLNVVIAGRIGAQGIFPCRSTLYWQ
jgi:hypothetical protein